MPWRPLSRIAFAVAVYPFQPSSPADLPLELGDELYIIEQGGANGEWYRGYLVAPPSLLAGLTSVKGQTLEARVFSGIFPKNCVEVREVLGDTDGQKNGAKINGASRDSTGSSLANVKVNGMFDTKKMSQVMAIKQEDGAQRRSAMSPSPSLPLTPLSTGPRDPKASRPSAPVPMLKIGDETPTSASEPLVDEIASCLREWHSTNIHELLLTRQYGTLEDMSNIVLELDIARRQLLHDVLTGQERAALREETVWNLVRGNKMLSGDVIVRDPKQRGRLLTGDDSAIELAKLQSQMSMLDGGLTQQVDTVMLHHLLFEVNAVTGTNSGSVCLAISLCLKEASGEIKPLSETYGLNIPSAESFSSLAQSGKLKTLFTELNATDVGEGSGAGSKLYVVVKVLGNESHKSQFMPSSRSSNSSRDGSSGNKGGLSHTPSAKGNLKARRSMIWGPKSRGNQSMEESTRPVHSSDSNTSQGKQAGNSPKESAVTRYVGIGVLEVGPLLRNGKDVEQIINFWSPLGETDEEDDKNDGFDEIIRSILPSRTGRYARSYRAARLHTHLYPLTSKDPETLIRNNPTLLHDVTQTPRMGFAEAPTKPRSDIYLTLCRAMISQDALLSHPVNGQVHLPQISGLRNLQLTLEIRNSSGARIEQCIFASSNSPGHTAWRTTVTERGSSWNQTIRLNIPADEIRGSHVIMSLADAPEFPFALCWIPLWDQEAFIRDGRHSLLLYAYDKFTSAMENGKGAYLSLPWSALGKNESTKDEAVTGPLATLALDTNLCSTEYSQDQVVVGLINWKDRPATQLLELLRRIVFVPELEIVKQLRGVFDALFGIIVEHSGNEEFEDLVFSDLVTVLGIVHDRRFNLGPLVDKYADEQFNFPFATPCLIRSYSRLLQATPDSQQSRNLRAAFKVGKHILKFIINAREQQKAKEANIGITNIQSTFNRDLRFIFKLVESLIQNPAPSLVGSKTLAVQHFHIWLPELSKALSKDEVVEIALSFMEACKDVKNMLILYKLVLILNYTRLPLFQEPKERKLLSSRCVGWLAPYWGQTTDVTDQYRDQVRLCSSIIAELLKHPEPEHFEYMPKAVASYCAIEEDGVDESDWLSLLFSKSFPFQLKLSKTEQKFDESLIELSAVIATLSKIPNPKDLGLDHDDLAIFLSRILETHQSVLSCGAYPASWLSLHIYHHRSVMKSLEYVSSILFEKFLPSPEDADTFDMELWKSYFSVLLKLVSSESLALETFPEQKRRAVWKIAGDVRENGAELLRKSWETIGWETTSEERQRYGLQKLGGYQVQYVPSLVPPIIELCLSAHEGLRRVAVEILQSMIVSEWQLNEDLVMVEAEMISTLDDLFKTKNVNGGITQKLFITELLDLFESNPVAADEELLMALKELVATVDELLDLLVASRNGNITESLNTLKLMEFMKDMQKEDIFIRYVHELSQGQAAARNYTEAGLALQFHADLYDWDFTRMVPALSNPSFSEQTAFDRKEALYFEIIQHFEDGKAWAHALNCYRELAHHYEHTILDFSKLSRAQSSMAKIYDTIVKEDAQVPRYFCVTFKGLGFPTALQNKQYIFEGLPYDRMVTFTDRMQKQYPAAQIISSGAIEDMEGQFLQISAVSIHRDIHHPVYQRSKVPLSVREHLLASTPSLFSVTTKRHTGSRNVKEQWVVKTLYTTAEPFPNVLRRSEIVASEEVPLSPLQTAVERTVRKTQELMLFQKRVALGDEVNLAGLTDILGPLLDIDSTSSSSIARYRAFLDENQDVRSYFGTEDEGGLIPMDPLKNALSVAMVDHALAIKQCISLYSQSAYQDAQAQLMHRFEAAFAPEIAFLAPLQAPSLSAEPLSNGSITPQQSPKPQTPQSHVATEQSTSRSTRERGATQSSEKPSASHRLSLNLFKRSNHGHSSSTATITAAGKRSAEQARREAAKPNGISGDDKSETNGSVATSHSTSQSRDVKNDAQKRRSFFGSNGTTSNADAPKDRPQPVVSPARTPTEDMRTTQQRIMERARAARSQERLTSSKTYSTIPPQQHYSASAAASTASLNSRPATADQQNGLAKYNSGGSNKDTSATGGPTSVRGSVRKRFSMLKVGRKASKMNMRDGFGGQVLKEE